MGHPDERSLGVEKFLERAGEVERVIDLRSPEEYRIGTIPRAVNIPLESLEERIDSIPTRDILVFCESGTRSGKALDLLLASGFDACELKGGYRAYRFLLSLQTGDEEDPRRRRAPDDDTMPLADVGVKTIDVRDLRCPAPIVKVADEFQNLPFGSHAVITATESAFGSDIRAWCERTGNHLVRVSEHDGAIEAVVQKAARPERQTATGDDKTMVLFSGDLDKTIAAFIIANGSAALGRNVTLFFTFWGLNILRKPAKASVAKSAVERMFGALMPRGTRKLGLSRMNMLGAGPKMIRGIMKRKGISSLEELMQQAKEHGVRLIACQMSMDIMGIHAEELIDGVELGGVSTFIAAGEMSDMSFFI